MTTPDVKEFDPFAEAFNPPVQTYDLFGKVEFNAWSCAFQKGVQGGVPFDPAVHEKRHTMIDIYIQPLPEIEVKYPRSLEFHDVTWSVAWAKIALPSIKALGIESATDLNGKWARVTRVPSGKQYEKKDKATGQPTGEFADETTFKFVQFFADEDECRAAYLAAGGQPSNGANGANGHNVATNAPVSTEDAEKATAYSFLKVIVTNAARGKDGEEAKGAVALALSQYPPVAKFYTMDSPEVLDLIQQVALPF